MEHIIPLPAPKRIALIASPLVTSAYEREVDPDRRRFETRSDS